MNEPEDFVICRICGGEFQQITHSHLREHDMTLEEYQNEFPEAQMISEKMRKRMSKAQAVENHPFFGKTRPKHSEAMTGENNPAKRPEVRAKISATKTKYWKDPENIAKMSGKNNVMKRQKVRDKVTGENSGNWKGGISFLPYCPAFSKSLRERYRNYWGRVCVLTDLMRSTLGPDAGLADFEGHEIFYGERLSVHHIYGNKMAGCDDTELTLIPLQRPYNGKKFDGLKLEDHPFYITLFMFKDLERRSREQRINGG